MSSSIDISTQPLSAASSFGVATLFLYTLKGAALGLGVGTVCLPWYLMKCFFELRDQGIDKKGYVLSWVKMGAGVGCAIGLCGFFNGTDKNASSISFDKCTNSLVP